MIAFLSCLLLAAEWPDPIAHEVVPYATAGLTHGPMLGAPTATSMRVWVRTKAPIAFRVLYGESLPLVPGESREVAGQNDATADNTGWVEVTELEPATRYYYAIVTPAGLADIRPDVDDVWPSFRTLPDATTQADQLNNPDGRFDLKFGIGCCLRQVATSAEKIGRQSLMNPRVPAFHTILKQHIGTADEIAFQIIHGDFLYEEGQDGTAEGLRANYRLYLDRGRYMSDTLRYLPLVATFDDHEAGSNLDGAGEVGLGDGPHLFRDRSLAVWQEFLGWTNGPSETRQPLRFGTAIANNGQLVDDDGDFAAMSLDAVSTLHVGPQLALQKQPASERGGKNVGVYAVESIDDDTTLSLRPPLRGDGPVPYSIGTHHYFDQRIGNCHFLYLDTRGERAKWKGVKHAGDADRFILGETQRDWVIKTATESTADFLFLISPDPWMIYHSAFHVRPEKGAVSKGDGFAGYLHERRLLLDALDAIEKPVLIFTGDVHNSFSVRVTDNVWELMTGPMNSAGHPLGTAGLPPLCGPFESGDGGPLSQTVQILWVGGYPDNAHYLRLRNIWYAVVQVNNVMTASRPEGRGLQHVTYDEPQILVRWHDGHTGALAYVESISTLDAKPTQPRGPKRSRWLPDLRID